MTTRKRRRHRRRVVTQDTEIRAAEALLSRLWLRANRAHDVIHPRLERNHWAETAERLWGGQRT